MQALNLGKRIEAAKFSLLLKRNQRISLRLSTFVQELGVQQGNAEEYFRSLGIKPTDDQRKIRSAYIKKIREFHPDVNNSKEAYDISKALNEAYNFLSKKGGFSAVSIAEAVKENIPKDFVVLYMKARDSDMQILKSALNYSTDIYSAEEYVRSFNDWHARFERLWRKKFGAVENMRREALNIRKKFLSLSESASNGETASLCKANAKLISEQIAYIDDIVSILEEVKASLSKSIGNMESSAMVSLRK
ncbi:MAG: J domain-containing protein [Candidatus Micrarchaeaceae archaeon]